MAQAERARIAFVGPRAASSTHYRSFKQIIPPDVQIDFYGLELAGQSLFDLEGKKDTIIQRAAELAEKHRWQAAIFSGAPVEITNDAFRIQHTFAVELQLHLQHAVSRGVLWPHADC